MIFEDLQPGDSVLLDANTLVYYFIAHPALGPSCGKLIERIGKNELVALTSTHMLSEIAHRLMVIECSQKFGWTSKIVDRLKRQPTKLQGLTSFKAAIEQVPKLKIQRLTIPANLVADAASVSIEYGLLSNDALTVAIMQANGLTNIASNDADFDRVPWITRFAPA
jgi:predicted nucleic acid-binding protein